MIKSQLSGIVGTPGGVGGATLGLGVVLKLHDEFTKNAIRIDRQMQMLDDRTSVFARNMDTGLHTMSVGLGALGGAAGILGALSFPVRDAVNFQSAITQAYAVVDDKVTVTRGHIEELSQSLSGMLAQDPTMVAQNVQSILAAGIEDLERAGVFAEVGTKISIATNSASSDVNSGLLSVAQAYGYTNPMYSDEQARGLIERLGDMMFEASKQGRFSDTQVSDFAAFSKQIPKLASIAEPLGIQLGELMATSAVSTLGGQNAQRAFTGLNQAFMDLMGAEKGRARWEKGFLQFAEGRGVNFENARGQIDIANFIRGNSLYDLLGEVRAYANINSADMGSALQNEGIMAQVEALNKGIAEGRISEDTQIGQSSEAQQLLADLGRIGKVDINKVKEIFPSVWGLMAVLPLIGPQYEKLGSSIAEMEDAAGSVQEAFAYAMQDVRLQWMALVNNIKNLNVIWGSTLLDTLSMTLQGVNLVLRGLIAVSTQMEWLIGPILQVASLGGLFLAGAGAVLAFDGAMMALANHIRWNAQEAGVFSRLIGGSLSVALWRVTAIVTGLVAASAALQWAWRANFLGVQDIGLEWYKKMSWVFTGVRELLANLDWGTGLTSISGETRAKLQQNGLLEFVYDLTSVIYRAGMFLQGFSSAASNVFRAWVRVFSSAGEGLLSFLEASNILPGVHRWLESIFRPTAENVDAWTQMGRAVGRVVASLALVAGVSGVVTVLSTLARTAWIVHGGFMGLVSSPLLLGLGALVGAGWLLKRAFEGDWFGFAAVLSERAPRLASFVGDFSGRVQELWGVLREYGLGAALAQLHYDLTGTFPAEALQALGVRLTSVGTALRRFPNDIVANGWQEASLRLLDSLLGPEQSQALLARADALRDALTARLEQLVGTFRGLPTLFRAVGFEGVFRSLFYSLTGVGFDTALYTLETQWVAFTGRLAEHWTALLADLGLTEQWAALQAGFALFSGELERRWASLVAFFTGAWADLKTGVDWASFWSTMTALGSGWFVATQRLWDEGMAAIGAAWDALMNQVDWASLNELIRSVAGALGSFGSGERFSGWASVFNTAAAAVNVFVDALQLAFDLMTMLFAKPGSDEFVRAWGNIEISSGALLDRAIGNPAGALLGAAAVGVLVNRVASLFRWVNWLLTPFRLFNSFMDRLPGRATKASGPGGLGSLVRSLRNLVRLSGGPLQGLMNRLLGLTTRWAIFRDFLAQRVGPALLRVGGQFRGLAGGAIRSVLIPALLRVGTVIGGVVAGISWPVTLAVAAATALIGAGIAAWKTNFMGFRDWLSGLGATISEAFTSAWDGLVSYFENAPQRLGNALQRQLDGMLAPVNELRRWLGMDPIGVNAPAAKPAQGPAANVTAPPASVGGAPVSKVADYAVQQTPLNHHDPTLNAAEQLAIHYGAMAKAENSAGGKAETAAEVKALTAVLTRLNELLDKNPNASAQELVVKLDSHVVGRAYAKATRRDRQSGGN